MARHIRVITLTFLLLLLFSSFLFSGLVSTHSPLLWVFPFLQCFSESIHAGIYLLSWLKLETQLLTRLLSRVPRLKLARISLWAWPRPLLPLPLQSQSQPQTQLLRLLLLLLQLLLLYQLQLLPLRVSALDSLVKPTSHGLSSIVLSLFDEIQ